MKVIAGHWETALIDVDPDAVICDIPYSRRTVDGYGSVSSSGFATRGIGDYDGWDLAEAESFAVHWAARVRRWFVMFGSHDQVFGAGRRLEEISELYTFPPIVWIKSRPTPRLYADGPSMAAEFILVSRKRRRLDRAEKRHRPGAYLGDKVPTKQRHGIVGQKPLWLMRAVVRDYSEPGDLVVDPTAGTGSTIVAALMEGRRAVGAEINPDRAALANERARTRQNVLI